MTQCETRHIHLVDLPLIRKMGEKGIILSYALRLTREDYEPASAIWTGMLFSRGVHSMVARRAEEWVVGQYQFRSEDEPNARLLYVAPNPDEHSDDTLWLHLLDAMAGQAGSDGAHHLIAEVDPRSPLFEILRRAGFAVFSRQAIWRHEGGALPAAAADLDIRRVGDDDAGRAQGLLGRVMPSILEPIAPVPQRARGFGYWREGRMEGYVTVDEGRQGILLVPYFLPDALPAASSVLARLTAEHRRDRQIPVYVGIWSFQSWLEDLVAGLGFIEWQTQASLVRHIAAGVRQANFSRVEVNGAAEAALDIYQIVFREPMDSSSVQAGKR
jgi:hypothetical protein